jgi:hypothetical protein
MSNPSRYITIPIEQAREALMALNSTPLRHLTPATLEARKVIRQAIQTPASGYTTTRASWTGSVTHTCNLCGKNDFRSEHSAMSHKCESIPPQTGETDAASLTTTHAHPGDINDSTHVLAHSCSESLRSKFQDSGAADTTRT